MEMREKLEENLASISPPPLHKYELSSISSDSHQSFLSKAYNSYKSELPSMIGFFSIANPLSALFELNAGIPLDNSVATRAVTLTSAFMGLQKVLSQTRHKAYSYFGIDKASEDAKRLADCVYGSLAGFALTPAFHTATKYLLDLPQTADSLAAAGTGALVGATTGVVSWFTADAVSDAWSNKNDYRRNGPGMSYLRQLPSRAQKKLLATAAIGSALFTLGTYAYRYNSEPHMPDHFPPALEDRIIASR